MYRSYVEMLVSTALDPDMIQALEDTNGAYSSVLVIMCVGQQRTSYNVDTFAPIRLFLENPAFKFSISLFLPFRLVPVFCFATVGPGGKGSKAFLTLRDKNG